MEKNKFVVNRKNMNILGDSMIRSKYFLFIIIILFVVTNIIYAQEILYQAKCKNSDVSIRKGPGTNFDKDKRGPLALGRTVFVMEEKNGWYRFKLKEDEKWSGWTLGKFFDKLESVVKEKAPEVKPEKTPSKSVSNEIFYLARCKNANVNLRKGPGTNFGKDKKGPLGKGKTVYVIDKQGDWLKLRFNKEDRGWSAWTLGKFLDKVEVQKKDVAQDSPDKFKTEIKMLSNDKKDDVKKETIKEVKKQLSYSVLYPAKVKNSNVSIRKGPGTDFGKDKKGPLKIGRVVYIVEEKGNWSRFKFSKEGKSWSGWTLGKFLTKIDENAIKKQPIIEDFPDVLADENIFKTDKSKTILYSAKCNKAKVNIRKGPGTTYGIAAKSPLTYGTTVYIISEIGEWVEFRFTQNDTGWSGWVLSKFLKKKQIKRKEELISLSNFLYSIISENDEVTIYTGPGENYKVDDIGKIMKGLEIYVVEEKNGWVKFNLLPGDKSWAGWVEKAAVE